MKNFLIGISLFVFVGVVFSSAWGALSSRQAQQAMEGRSFPQYTAAQIETSILQHLGQPALDRYRAQYAPLPVAPVLAAPVVHPGYRGQAEQYVEVAEERSGLSSADTERLIGLVTTYLAEHGGRISRIEYRNLKRSSGIHSPPPIVPTPVVPVVQPDYERMARQYVDVAEQRSNLPAENRGRLIARVAAYFGTHHGEITVEAYRDIKRDLGILSPQIPPRSAAGRSSSNLPVRPEVLRPRAAASSLLRTPEGFGRRQPTSAIPIPSRASGAFAEDPRRRAEGGFLGAQEGLGRGQLPAAVPAGGERAAATRFVDRQEEGRLISDGERQRLIEEVYGHIRDTGSLPQNVSAFVRPRGDLGAGSHPATHGGAAAASHPGAAAASGFAPQGAMPAAFTPVAPRQLNESGLQHYNLDYDNDDSVSTFVEHYLVTLFPQYSSRPPRAQLSVVQSSQAEVYKTLYPQVLTQYLKENRSIPSGAALSALVMERLQTQDAVVLEIWTLLQDYSHLDLQAKQQRVDQIVAHLPDQALTGEDPKLKAISYILELLWQEKAGIAAEVHAHTYRGFISNPTIVRIDEIINRLTQAAANEHINLYLPQTVADSIRRSNVDYNLKVDELCYHEIRAQMEQILGPLEAPYREKLLNGFPALKDDVFGNTDINGDKVLLGTNGRPILYNGRSPFNAGGFLVGALTFWQMRGARNTLTEINRALANYSHGHDGNSPFKFVRGIRLILPLLMIRENRCAPYLKAYLITLKSPEGINNVSAKATARGEIQSIRDSLSLEEWFAFRYFLDLQFKNDPDLRGGYTPYSEEVVRGMPPRTPKTISTSDWRQYGETQLSQQNARIAELLGEPQQALPGDVAHAAASPLDHGRRSPVRGASGADEGTTRHEELRGLTRPGSVGGTADSLRGRLRMRQPPSGHVSASAGGSDIGAQE